MKDMAVPLIALAVLLSSATAYTETEGEEFIIEQLTGSPDIPDWVAYSFFLLKVNGRRHDFHIFADAFGIEQDTVEGASRVHFLESWFLESAAAIERERNVTTAALLCSDDWEDMNLEEFIQGVEQLETEVERIYQVEYDATEQQLSSSERQAFKRYLRKSKAATSLTDMDNRKFYEEAGEEEFRITQAKTCERLPAEYASWKN